jgi:hypothetical protein
VAAMSTMRMFDVRSGGVTAHAEFENEKTQLRCGSKCDVRGDTGFPRWSDAIMAHLFQLRRHSSARGVMKMAGKITTNQGECWVQI